MTRTNREVCLALEAWVWPGSDYEVCLCGRPGYRISGSVPVATTWLLGASFELARSYNCLRGQNQNQVNYSSTLDVQVLAGLRVIPRATPSDGSSNKGRFRSPKLEVLYPGGPYASNPGVLAANHTSDNKMNSNNSNKSTVHGRPGSSFQQ